MSFGNVVTFASVAPDFQDNDGHNTKEYKETGDTNANGKYDASQL